jgi:hypothetical protein
MKIFHKIWKQDKLVIIIYIIENYDIVDVIVLIIENQFYI